MAYSVDYDRLKVIAAEEAGLTLDQLSDDDLETVNAAPNEAVEMIAAKRRWPFFEKALSLAVVADDTYVVLPADFRAFVADAGLNFSSGTGYCRLRKTTLAHIQQLRAFGPTTGAPQWWALGPTGTAGDSNDLRYELHLWPTADASYTLLGLYVRDVRAMSAGDDTPDFPTALHRAVKTATRIAIREAVNKEVPEMLLGRLEQEIAEAARILLNPAAADDAPLHDVVRRSLGLERGVNISLSESYPD